jgi:uncharacterized membrane protein
MAETETGTTGGADLLGARVVGELAKAPPTIRAITVDDITDALRAGAEDFRAMPAFGMTIGLFYALGGVAALWLLTNFGGSLVGIEGLAVMVPLIAGFALIGPFAAMGLYEASRRRDLGQKVGIGDIFGVRRATTTPSIMFLGFILVFTLLVWLRVAAIIYALFFGLNPPGVEEILTRVFTTTDGFAFLIIGNAVGAGFAFLVFSITVVSFPYMLEKDTDAVTAVALSVSAVAKNTIPLAGWALFVGIALAVSWLPFFLGLIVVLPVLGHATWRLYKRMIVFPDAA